MAITTSATSTPGCRGFGRLAAPYPDKLRVVVLSCLVAMPFPASAQTWGDLLRALPHGEEQQDRAEARTEDDLAAIRRAAQRGDDDAQYSLGNRYARGQGVPQDDRIAAHWYGRAVEQGHQEAEARLEQLVPELGIHTGPEPAGPEFARPEPAVESPPRAVFREDWGAGALDPFRWVTFGSPTSRIVRFFQGRSDVFDNNGDPNYESGAVTVDTFDLGAEWVSIEADVYLDYWNAGGCWAGAMIGLADPDASPSRLDRFKGVDLYFTLHAEGDACWATPPEHRRRVWFSGAFSRLDGSRERIPPFSVEGSEYANRWARMRIAIHPDDRVSLYMDDEWLWTSVGALDPALRWGRRLILGNRSSGSAGKAYLDNLEVWTYRDSRTTNQ